VRKRLVVIAGAVVLGGIGIAVPTIALASGGGDLVPVSTLQPVPTTAPGTLVPVTPQPAPTQSPSPLPPVSMPAEPAELVPAPSPEAPVSSTAHPLPPTTVAPLPAESYPVSVTPAPTTSR